MPHPVITSPHNPLWRMLVSLAHPKGIRRHGLALVAGAKQIHEIRRDFPARCEALVLAEGAADAGVPGGGALPPIRLAPELFARLDAFGTRQPLLLARVDPCPLFDPGRATAAGGCWLAVPFQDPANVGAVIRSAAALGAAGVVLLEEAAHAFHPRSLRAAGGAVFRIPLHRGPRLRDVHALEMPLVALSADGRDVGQYAFPAAFCLVAGLEGPGLSPALRQMERVAIPMAAGVESLNAATAAAIGLYAWRAASRP